MSNNELWGLFKAMTGPETPHLSDEKLAEIADAEMAGQDIEQQFSQELAHLEQCEDCALAYSQIIEMLDSAVQALVLAPETAENRETTWRQKLEVTADRLNQSLKVAFRPATTPALAEPNPHYGPPDQWQLCDLDFPAQTPARLKINLSRQTVETATLIIHLEDNNRRPLVNQPFRIEFNDTIQSAETTPDGTATIKDFPLTALTSLTITIPFNLSPSE